MMTPATANINASAFGAPALIGLARAISGGVF
jgi:hypothetical protein